MEGVVRRSVLYHTHVTHRGAAPQSGNALQSGNAPQKRYMSTNKRKTCDRGHSFIKSSDCPSCPICAAEDKPESGFLARLSAPARRALEHAGITTLALLAQHSEREILALHGVGPKTIPALSQALNDAGLTFAMPAQNDLSTSAGIAGSAAQPCAVVG